MFNLQRYMFYIGRDLHGLLVRAISLPGVLARLSSIIAERGLNILYCSTTVAEEHEEGIILLFIDFTDSETRPQELAEELRRLDFVREVKLITPKYEGFIVDDVSFPLMVGSERAILMTEAALRGLFIDIRRHIGSGGEAILYFLGTEVGKSLAERYMKMAEEIGVEDLEGKAHIAAGLFVSVGYGLVESLEIDPETPRIRLRVKGCIECELGGSAEKPYSQFLRGMLAGYASVLFKRDMMARETRCIAVGDPYCEFEIISLE